MIDFEKYLPTYTAKLYESLGKREKQVFELLVLGKSLQEISEIQNVTRSTIASQCQTIYQRFVTDNGQRELQGIMIESLLDYINKNVTQNKETQI